MLGCKIGLKYFLQGDEAMKRHTIKTRSINAIRVANGINPIDGYQPHVGTVDELAYFIEQSIPAVGEEIKLTQIESEDEYKNYCVAVTRMFYGPLFLGFDPAKNEGES